jgi:hypothetical protein
MNTKFNVYIYIYVFFIPIVILYRNYSFIYLYKGYASYIHISRRYVKHKRLRTTDLMDAGSTFPSGKAGDSPPARPYISIPLYVFMCGA